MKMFKALILWLLCLICLFDSLSLVAQVRDNFVGMTQNDFLIDYRDATESVFYASCVDSCKGADIHRFKPQQLIAPVALVTLGAIGSEIDDFREFDFGIERSTKHHSFQVEDVLQYVPAAGFYALKICGVESRHNYRDASLILLGSYGIASVISFSLKKVTDVERPNGLNNESFPSGHSSVAFMSAEFLRMEYKDVSPWIGVAGYAVAAGTALARIRHNEHWVTDLLAGAGVGVLSTRIAYWVYPTVQKILFGKSLARRRLHSQGGQKSHSCTSRTSKFAFIGMPYYNGESTGLSLALQF